MLFCRFVHRLKKDRHHVQKRRAQGVRRRCGRSRGQLRELVRSWCVWFVVCNWVMGMCGATHRALDKCLTSFPEEGEEYEDNNPDKGEECEGNNKKGSETGCCALNNTWLFSAENSENAKLCGAEGDGVCIVAFNGDFLPEGVFGIQSIDTYGYIGEIIRNDEGNAERCSERVESFSEMVFCVDVKEGVIYDGIIY